MPNEHLALLKKAKSSWLYPIYIPSYSRFASAPFLEMLRQAPPSVQRKVHIVVRPVEWEAYHNAYPWATVVPEKMLGVGPDRMRCLIDASLWGYKRIVMLDDDVIHVSLLQQIMQDNGKMHTRRFSAKVSGIPEPMLLLRSLSVACKLADNVFEERPNAAYGAARNALFSGDVDTSIGATLNKGSFPACTMFFDVERFKMRYMPEPYHYHGEDLAMFLETMSNEMEVFTLPGIAYDAHNGIKSTIPLDPLSAVGRPHLQTTEQDYPYMHPYLKVSMKNKLGGVMRIGMNWKKWYADTGTTPVEILLANLTKEI